MSRPRADFIRRDRALIFRITHVQNLPWILEHGIHCSSSSVRDPGFREIGSPSLIRERTQRAVPDGPGGTLADYVPFYFTPLSPMLLNITTGHAGIPKVPASEIAVLVSSVPKLTDLGLPYVLTDRHAYLAFAEFTADASGLDKVDWPLLQSRDFQRTDSDPGRFERYQAEALVHGCVPVDALLGVACSEDGQRARIQQEIERRRLDLPVVVRREWYFG